MLSSIINSLQPAGLLLAGAGLGSLIFSRPLAQLDAALERMGIAAIPHDDSRKWVEVAGATWGVVGVALLLTSHFLGG